METISIIVPAYNVAQCIGRCLESILAQTYKQLEIIVVNDGSRDDTLAVCETYACQDSRIQIIDQVNLGVSAARNAGLAYATGKYVGFVDPDDWIEEGMYEALYQCIEEGPYPICMCNYYKDTKKSSSPQKFSFEKTWLDKDEVVLNVISPMIGMDDLLHKYTYVMGCVWRCLYDRAFIEAHQLRFGVGITIMEDLVFNVEALLLAEGVCIEQGIWYHYIQNKNSVLHSYNAKMWEDQVWVHNRLEALLTNAGLEKLMRNRLDMRYIGMAFSAIYNEVNRGSKKAVREKLRNVVEICSDEKFKETLDRAKPIQRKEAEVD